jgi:predicted dehydrogenase
VAINAEGRVSEPIRAACVGAGARAYQAHYPCLKRLADEVEIAAVCELDPARLARAGNFFDLPAARRYTDLAAMLAEVRPALVYAIMGPAVIRPVAERCFAAGAHVVMEKPPGATLADVEALAAAARAAGRQGVVTFQRRLAAVLQEARQRILARGPLTMCVVEFHKDMVGQPAPPWGVSTLWEDIVHVVDLARYLCDGRPVAVHAYRDARGAGWPNIYNALVRFDSGATAIITGNRASGGRYLRVEAHGLGIGAYMDDFPARLAVLADRATAPAVISGADLAGSATVADYDGVMATHRRLLACLRAGQPALTSLDDALETMRLVDWIERAGAAHGE